MTSARRAFAASLALAAALVAWPPVAARAAGDTSDIVVHARKNGATITVEVDCPVDAPRAVVWDVLTDYDHMAKFISNLQASTIRMRMGDRLQVHPKGQASRGPLTFPFEMARRKQYGEIRDEIVRRAALK
jgi:hypothetical protein